MRGGLYIAASILTISYAIAAALINAAESLADEFDFGSDPRTAMLEGKVAATRNKAGGKGAEQAAATKQERVALHLKGGL